MIKKLLLASTISLLVSTAFGANYTVTVTNNLDEELLAPILITSAANDGEIFTGTYVTPEAEEQILTGDPAKLAARIGEDVAIGHGTDGPPGVLLAPGKSVSFTIDTDATSVRVLAMVAPTMVPDNYVTTVVDIHATHTSTTSLIRYDIGHDEGTMMNMASDGMMDDDMKSDEGMMDHGVATITFERN
jgi:hypothetical protein